LHYTLIVTITEKKKNKDGENEARLKGHMAELGRMRRSRRIKINNTKLADFVWNCDVTPFPWESSSLFSLMSHLFSLPNNVTVVMMDKSVDSKMAVTFVKFFA